MVTYRRFDAFKATVESLLPTLPLDSKLVIIYNQEGKYEDDERYFAYFDTLPEAVRVLVTGDNEGWGASLNEGLAVYGDWKEYEYVLELNNDVLFSPDWFAKAEALMVENKQLGILGLWKHTAHGPRMRLPGLIVKDNMPAVAWLFRSLDLLGLLPFPEKGPCKTRGGNGEDTGMVNKAQELGWWVGGPEEDLAEHMDGYQQDGDDPTNPAYL